MHDVFTTFRAFMEGAVIPHRDAHPEWIRLDGAQTGGNWEVFGRFERAGARWRVHADSHFEPLLIAYDATRAGEDPFVEEPTTRGLRLDLREDLGARVKSGFRHLYIYNDRPAR
jgi:hypothetical protein